MIIHCNLIASAPVDIWSTVASSDIVTKINPFSVKQCFQLQVEEAGSTGISSHSENISWSKKKSKLL